MTRTPLLLDAPERVACVLAQVSAGRDELQTAKFLGDPWPQHIQPLILRDVNDFFL